MTPGLASQRGRFPTARRLSNQRGLRQFEKGRRPKDPTVRREGTREPRPASWRHLLLRFVAATAGAQWSDGWGRSTYVLALFVYGRHDANRRSPDSSVRRTYSFTVRAHLKYGQRSLWFL